MHSSGIPWLALVVVLGTLGCSGEPEGEPGAEEAPDPATCDALVAPLPSEGWTHVDEGSVLSHAHNPPASGPHYPVWPRWGPYDEPVPRGYWIHALEHGGIVFLHRPDAPPDVVLELRAAYDELPDDPACGHKRAVFTPDPGLDSAVAVVAIDHVIEGDRLDVSAVLAFVQACRNIAPEDVCADGAYP